jgi:RimJ/RimL family protein N-acetyltransferase
MRQMTVLDAPDLFALVTRPSVGRMPTNFSTHWTLAAAAPFLQDWRWQKALGLRVAIEAAGGWAGRIGCADDPEPAISDAIKPEFAGRRLAQDAVRALAASLFTRFVPTAWRAGVFTNNPAFARVLRILSCGSRNAIRRHAGWRREKVALPAGPA